MKILKLLSILFLLCYASTITAEDNSSTTNKIALQSKRSNDRPQIRGLRGKRPSNILIYCSYSREHICFELPGDADFMEVTITDAYGITWSGFVTQDEPCCDIPPMASPAQIECTVDMTATFTGTLIF